jgi:hypothetical protein
MPVDAGPFRKRMFDRVGGDNEPIWLDRRAIPPHRASRVCEAELSRNHRAALVTLRSPTESCRIGRA